MAGQTPYEYYSNSDNYGQYQYVPLREVIDGMMLQAQDSDSYLKNTKRSLMLLHAKNGIRELTRTARKQVLAYEITVPNSLVFPVPQDFMDYVRVSVVTQDPSTGSYRLEPLDFNSYINTAIGYLQDHNAELLFDSDGNILMAESMNAISIPYRIYKFSTCYQPNLDTSKLSKFGEFKIDKDRGLMLFSSELADKEIVVEYFSDGLQAELQEDEVKVHKTILEALEQYIYYNCIKLKRTIPNIEKRTAWEHYKGLRHKVKLANLDVDMLRISRALRANQIP